VSDLDDLRDYVGEDVDEDCLEGCGEEGGAAEGGETGEAHGGLGEVGGNGGGALERKEKGEVMDAEEGAYVARLGDLPGTAWCMNRKCTVQI